mgnify:FL=1
MEGLMGKCRFCGNEFGVLAEDQRAADEAASKDCGCGGWEKEMEARRKKFELREELIRLAGEGCEELMFKPVSGEVLTKLTEIGNMIVDGQIRQATLKIDGTTFTLSGGEKIKVKRGYSYEQNGEIE